MKSTKENVSWATICLKQTICGKLLQLHVVCLDEHECSDMDSPPFNPCKSISCTYWRKGQWFWFTAFASRCGPVWHEAWQKGQKYRNRYWGKLRDDRKKSILTAGRQAEWQQWVQLEDTFFWPIRSVAKAQTDPSETLDPARTGQRYVLHGQQSPRASLS